MYIGITHYHYISRVHEPYSVHIKYARFYQSQAEGRKNWNAHEILFLRSEDVPTSYFLQFVKYSCRKFAQNHILIKTSSNNMKQLIT